MRVNLLTDAPKHNLALMKISAYHKARGDEVLLNEPQQPADLTYGSWLFDFTGRYYCDFHGGPGWDPTIRLNGFDGVKPDYGLFPIDYSLGYTWEYCPRKCGFCCVPKQKSPKAHHSIWEFHDPRFNKICLLNNNTFSDPRWKETFEEVWEADLTVIDENGYDLRLLDEEKADTLQRTKWQGVVKFAWDCMADEKAIIRGLDIAARAGLNKPFRRAMVYVLIGYNTSFKEDLYRCQHIHDFGLDPYPMIYRGRPTRSRPSHLNQFLKFIVARYYRSYKTIEEAWQDYGRK